MTESTRRALRTLAQLVVSSAFTAAVSMLAGGLSPQNASLVLVASQVVVTFAHNWLEDNTNFPTVLKAPPAPPGD